MSLPYSESWFFMDEPKMLSTPIVGRVETYASDPPRIVYGGTSWRWSLYKGREPITLTDGQEVWIWGRVGNCLLISTQL